MIQKIGKLNIEKTEEQESQQWAEVLSHRNKLLANSDWTQLADSGLTPECVEQWYRWRKNLKAVNRVNFGHMEAAEKAIATLSRRIPFNVYASKEDAPDESRYETLDEFRVRVLRYLDAAFEARCRPSFLDNPVLVEEQFKEAVDFLSNADESQPYPLLSVTAEIYGMSYKTVAEEFVARKVALTKLLVNLKQKYFYFHKLVISAQDDVELSKIQAEIKQWISTST